MRRRAEIRPSPLFAPVAAHGARVATHAPGVLPGRRSPSQVQRVFRRVQHPPPTRHELMASFTGAEIAALISEGASSGATPISTPSSRPGCDLDPLQRLVSGYRHWIGGVYLITGVVPDDGVEEVPVRNDATLDAIRSRLGRDGEDRSSSSSAVASSPSSPRVPSTASRPNDSRMRYVSYAPRQPSFSPRAPPRTAARTTSPRSTSRGPCDSTTTRMSARLGSAQTPPTTLCPPRSRRWTTTRGVLRPAGRWRRGAWWTPRWRRRARNIPARAASRCRISAAGRASRTSWCRASFPAGCVAGGRW